MPSTGGAAAAAAAAPTGCFKCGRPGHWSRDCPSSSSVANSNPIPNSDSRSNFTANSFKKPSAAEAPAAAPRKAPRSRPKLTADLLLSDDGLGYALRHFPRAFKFHGRGHEVDDLGNLIGMYAEWHSHLIPYYSFDQFIRKVEQVGASKRVRRCIADLKERVARGGDPTKLHEPPIELVDPAKEPDECRDEGMNMEEPPLEAHGVEEETDKESSASMETLDHMLESVQRETRKIEVTEEQKARMEANRLKALEIAKQRLLNNTH